MFTKRRILLTGGFTALLVGFALMAGALLAQDVPQFRLPGLYVPGAPGYGVRADAVVGTSDAALSASAIAPDPSPDQWLKSTAGTGAA